MRLGILFALSISACASGNTAAPDTSAPLDAYVMPDSACGVLPCEAIYVSRTGSDVAAGDKGTPLKTIGAAITKASASTPPRAVFVKAGVYPEAFAMKAGVGVYGGFDDAWTQTAGMFTVVDGPSSPAVTFDGIMIDTVLSTVTVKSANATAPGSSSYAIVITGSKQVELRGVTEIGRASCRERV